MLKLEEKLIKYILTPNEPTNQILKHIFSSGGKRIRPAIFLQCAKLLNYYGEHLYSIASVCEYIHTASLLHDDVIDNSTLRRNKPTVNSVWGDETAVLSGDLIYSTACRLMVKTKSLELIDCFAECIRFMSESELFQLELLWNIETTEEQYYRVVAGKTASLFEASAKTPAFLAQMNTEVINLLAEYGRNIGFAFQIFDDCLDYTSEEFALGKSVLVDLLEGKVTLPIIFGLKKEKADSPILRNTIKNIFETGQLDENEKQNLLNIVKQSGGLSQAYETAENHAKIARNALNKLSLILPQGVHQKEALEALHKVTYFVLNRNN